MLTILVLQLVAIAGIGALGLLVRHYLAPRPAEQGNPLATKEDIAEITRRLEGAKAESARTLESVHAAIGSSLGTHQCRYQREYDVLLQLSEKVVELRDATVTLRPESEYVNPDESDDERTRRQLQRYTAASRDLYQFYETRQPFFPESMLGALRTLDQAAWHEVIQDRHRSPRGEGFDLNYWENAAANSARIQAAADLVLAAIRARVQLWDKFDPGS